MYYKYPKLCLLFFTTNIIFSKATHLIISSQSSFFISLFSTKNFLKIMGSCGFEVYVKKSEVVTAVLPMHEHLLPMSNLDLLLPPLEVGVFFCYKKHEITSSSSPATAAAIIIKNALAQALVSFYPLAGEIVQNRLGEPELLCNNRGVDYIHAYAETELQELDLFHVDTSIKGKFIPAKKKPGPLSVQVTELKCGGLIIGCTFDHRVADAHSANIFLTSWAEIARAEKPTYTPTFRRSIFNPRHPPQYHSSIDEMYVLISSLPPLPKQLKLPCNEQLMTSRIYYIPSQKINLLQSQASYNGCKRTKFESFSSFLWKTIAEGESEEIKRIKLGIIVDGRQRFNKDRLNLSSINSYFGNVLSIPFCEANVNQVKEMELKGVANMVHSCIKSATSEEHFLDLIDWVELNRPKAAIVKVYCKNNENEEAIVVSSGLRFPISKINFGWGMPHFGSYHFAWGGETGYVMPMPSVTKDGDWVVYMHLKKKHLDIVEKNCAHIFRPFTSCYYLDIINDCFINGTKLE